MSNPYAPPPPGRTVPPRREPGEDGPPPTGDGPPPPGNGPPTGPGPRPGDVPPRRDPGSTPPSPPRAPLDPEAARAATRPVMHFALMMLAALVTGSFPLPWMLASFAFALGAVVLGARALITVRRSGLRGGIVVVLAAGVGFSAAMVVSVVGVLALWPAQMELQDCRRDALTIAAQEQCTDAFDDAVTERFRRATPGSGQD